MATYCSKVQAVRFYLKDLEEVRTLISKHWEIDSVNYESKTIKDHPPTAEGLTPPPAKLAIKNCHNVKMYVYEGEWVVVKPSGYLDKMTDECFEAQYSPHAEDPEIRQDAKALDDRNVALIEEIQRLKTTIEDNDRIHENRLKEIEADWGHTISLWRQETYRADNLEEYAQKCDTLRWEVEDDLDRDKERTEELAKELVSTKQQREIIGKAYRNAKHILYLVRNACARVNLGQSNTPILGLCDTCSYPVYKNVTGELFHFSQHNSKPCQQAEVAKSWSDDFVIGVEKE